MSDQFDYRYGTSSAMWSPTTRYYGHFSGFATNNILTPVVIDGVMYPCAPPPGFVKQVEPSLEALYPEFTIQHGAACKKSFQKGNIIRVLWAEPAGENAVTAENDGNGTEKRNGQIFAGNYGQKVFHGVKFFAIIERRRNYCIAVQIASYKGNGANKPSKAKHEHAIIYTGQTAPDPLPCELLKNGDKALLEYDIRAIGDDVDGEPNTLEQPSRINLGKVYTIEFNVRAASWGKVEEESFMLLTGQFWNLRRESFEPALRAFAAYVEEKRKASPRKRKGKRKTGKLGFGSDHVYKIISGIKGIQEEFDHTYCQRPKEFYTVGKVFTIVSCVESVPILGDHDDTESIVTERFEGFDESGKAILTLRRWFLVIQWGEESSLCLRILSYEGMGVSDKYVKGEHSIVYTGKTPSESEDQRAATSADTTYFQPAIRVKRTDRGDTLPECSRVRYSTVYQVRHDVLAREFGYVHKRREWLPRSLTRAHFERATKADGSESCAASEFVLNRLLQNDPDDEESGDDEKVDNGKDIDDDIEAEEFVIRKDLANPPCAEPTPRFGEGQLVLLCGSRQPGGSARMKPVRVRKTRVAAGVGQIEYQLEHPTHGGSFGDGTWFSEALLMG